LEVYYGNSCTSEPITQEKEYMAGGWVFFVKNVIHPSIQQYLSLLV
jgi:hypothetical protein